jgi:solute carrier family 25 protein 39/40
MSDHWDNRAKPQDDVATTFKEHRAFGGQGHDSIHGDNLVPGVSSTIAMAGDNNDLETGITAGQKMISALSGSLLTSLLGRRH